VAQEVKEYFGDMMFETIIPRSIKLSEAPSYGEPITKYNPESKGAKAYYALAEEVIDRG
jgi:chromosome partitioning protein